MVKGIKKTAKILKIFVACILLILATIPILLSNNRVQNFIVQSVTHELSTRLKSKVTVGKIEYKLFNSVKLNDLYVQDLERDTLIYVDETKANFNLRAIFSGKIIFTGLEFKNLYGNLKVDTTGHTNLDFVIKAFKTPKKESSSVITYKIDHLKIRNSRFSYSKQNGKPTRNAAIINPDSLRLSNINADIILHLMRKDTLSAEIKSLSMSEKSGFTLKKLSTQMQASTHGAKIQFIELLLPASQLNLTDIELKYDSLADFKHFVEKVKWNAPINNSSISFADFSAFIPEFKGINKSVTLKGQVSGRISSLRFKKMELKYGKSLSLNADLDLSGLPYINETFIYGQINELKADKRDIQDIVSGLSKKPFVLPKELNQLGTVIYKGNISGFLSNLVAYGNLKTNMGSISTDILVQLENKFKDLNYNGTVKSNNFELGKLLSNKNLGKASFSFNTNGIKKAGEAIRGNVKATVNEIEFNQYVYRDIAMDGKYDGTGFDGAIKLSDENINADFKGVIDLTKKLPVFDFELDVKDVNPHALHLIKTYPGALLSFSGRTNMIGNSPDNINGIILFDSIKLTNIDKTLNINEIKFISNIDGNNTNFLINSDYVNGSFKGDFKYSNVSSTINKIIQYYLPALSVSTKKYSKTQNHIDIDLIIENTDEISEVLNLPYQLKGTSTIKGSIDERQNKINITGNFAEFRAKKQSFENIILSIENQQQQLKLTTRAQMPDKKGSTRLYLFAAAAKDSVTTQLGWQNSSKITNAGEFQTITKFRNIDNKLAVKMNILPTQVIISDSIWDIRASKIELNPDKTIAIDNFKFENKEQFIHINGKVSQNLTDGVTVSMKDVDVDYVMQVLKLKGISFGGHVTGKAELISLLKQPVLLAELDVKKLLINNKLIGDTKVNSAWDNENKQILLGAEMYDENKKEIAIAKGVYVPKNDSLDVTFDTKGIAIGFLNTYFESVAQNVKGLGHGKFRMYGRSKNLGFEGNIFVDKGQATIKMLNTTYFFNDTVRLTRKTIAIKNMKIYDEEKNQGNMTGLITHNGMFQNMKYNVDVYGKKILAMNTRSSDNDYFFGRAYATGTVNIQGDTKEAVISINAVSQPKTKCYIQMGGASSASDNSFINFINTRSRTEKEIDIKKTGSNFNVVVDMKIDVTPDAELELIIDPKGGDAIKGKGSGNLRVQFDSFSDMKLYGTYAIDAGSYLFTLQTVIRKEFKIDKGSTIQWTGNPFDAQVDIRAIYPLTASLSDLLEDVSSSTNRGSVPVNCVLNLSENLIQPTIKFEIDLPLSDESMKQRVRSIINTEEMMNRQIAYLLVLSKFYTPDNKGNAGLNNTISFAVSTFSAHLNNLIQKSLNTNNLSLGVDWQKSELQTDEVKAQLNYQNKRIILNGEFGYRNENVNTSTNASKFIGDFDLEYLLIESGKLRAKAYSHTIDRAQLKEAKSTQGFGLIYKEDFESVGDMLNYYWKIITGITKKKKNE